jgi:TolB-like protein/DNA-binding winged helix-turn-helix (wHTH) protein/tetratricopeptide (TPR) repeat protein
MKHEASPPVGAVRFGVFEVDLNAPELRKQGIKIRVQDQPYQILRTLLDRPGQVVTREELRQRIWPADTFVDFDHGLNNAIKRLREVLGDSAESPRFVETIPRRGYRFIAPVAGADVIRPSVAQVSLLAAEGQGSDRQGEGRGRGYQAWAGILAAVVLVGGLILGLNLAGLRDRLLTAVGARSRTGGMPVPKIASIAVLPLENLSGDPAQEYFSDGMTDALITELAQIGSIRVISRTSSMQYKQTRKSLPEIARDLGVDGIVEGTVQRSGDRVRIDAQLVHGRTDKHLWANSYERDVQDVFALEREVADDIARQIQARLTTPNRAPLAPPRPVNLKALEAYLQGNYLLNTKGSGAGDEGRMRAAEYFQQAIDADPSFAPAYGGKADAYEDSYRPSSEDLAIARKAAERAVELDPTSSDARVELGDLKFNRAWDWPGAEEEYRRAIALNPNNAWAHHELGDFLASIGRLDEAWKEYEIAQELDPSKDYLSLITFLRGEHDRAIELLRKQVESHPDDGWGHWTLHRLLTVKGLYKESVQEFEKGLTLYGFPEIAARVHRAFATFGYKGAMQEAAKDFEHLQATNQVFFPMTLAQIYAGLGDKNRAFYWMEQAYKYRDRIGGDFGLELVRLEPMLDPLRSDPRYKDLLRRVGLPQ